MHVEQRGALKVASGAAGLPTLAILICTANRPETLRRCLASISASTVRPTEVLVSDDSGDDRTAAHVCGAYPWVSYFRGPRRGLCANRNAIIRQSTTDFISLLDDDAVVSPEFIARAFTIIANLSAMTLVTGTVIETDHPVVAANPSFLGFFSDPPNGHFRNINLNCNIFPRMAFNNVSFDEKIVYGYEDTDVCAQLLSRGYTIRYESGLVNTHLPPARNAILDEERFTQRARARFYTSVKRYLLWERNVPKLLAYIVIAPTHRILHAIKSGKWFDLPHVVPDVGFALRYAAQERARLIHAAHEPDSDPNGGPSKIPAFRR